MSSSTLVIMAIGKTAPDFELAEGIPFVGLADAGGKVAKIYRQEFNLLKLGKMPALFVIDKAGVIRFAHYGNSMMDVPTNEEVLKVLDDPAVWGWTKGEI